MPLLLTGLAAAYGAAIGLLVPRAAHRLAVQPEESWRATCPLGHPLRGPARGWVGLARCGTCAAAAPNPTPPPAPLPDVADTPPASANAPRGVADDGDVPPPGLPTAAEHAAPAPPALPDTPAPAPTPGPSPVVADATGPRGRAAGWYGPRTFGVAVTAALVCAVLAAATGPRPELAVWLMLTPFALLLALVDRAVHRLPDVLTLPLPAAAAVLLGVAALLPDSGGSWPLALLGGLALAGAYFVLFVIRPDGMGFGDVKLALLLGVALGWYGWTVLFAGAFAGFLLGSLYGLGLMVLRRAGRKTALPFGPFMLCGAFLGLLLGAPGPL